MEDCAGSYGVNIVPGWRFGLGSFDVRWFQIAGLSRSFAALGMTTLFHSVGTREN
jgi:hypothetical protein